MTLNFDILLNKTQADLLDLINTEENKFILANISRLQGKSVLMKVLCTQWLFSKNKTISYITPTLKLAKKFYNDLVGVIPEQLLTKSNASDLVLQSVTGSTLYFYSAEQGNRIRGTTNDYLVLDEAAFMKEGDENNHIWYSILAPTVKVKGKKVIMVSTPNSAQGFWYDLILKALAGTKGYAYIKRTIYDDAFCDDIEEIRASTPDIMFRQEYLCEFLDDARSFFTGYHNCYIEKSEFNWNLPLYAGIDWSSTGKDRTIITFINKDGLVIQYKIEGELDNKYNELANMINLLSNLKGTYAETNSIGSVMINELNKKIRKKVKGFNTTNDSKTEIITELALALEKGDISYSDKELDKELGAFGFSVTKTLKLAFEGLGGCHDDRVLSLAFALKAKKDFSAQTTFAFAGR